MIRLLSLTRSYILWVGLTLVISIAGIVLTILSSLYLGRISETAISMNYTDFVSELIPMLFIFILQTPIAYVNTYASSRFAEFSIFDLRNKVTQHIYNQPLSFIEKNSSADILSRLSSDVSIIQQFLQGSLLELVVQPLTFVVCAAFLFYLSFELSLVSFTAVPIFMAITLIISKPLERYAKEVQETIAEVTGVAQSAISGMPEAKSFCLETALEEKFERSVDRSVEKGLKMAKVSASISPVNNMMQFVPFILVFAYGGFLVISDRLSFGELIMFINLSNAVVNPLHLLPQAISSYRLAKAACARVYELLEEKIEDSGTKEASEVNGVNAEAVIEFSGVCFAYEGKELVLRSLDLILRRGELTGLVGASGCGKSTVIKLITGFYRPLKGNIKIYGTNVSEWDIEKLRHKIALVSQDTFLFPCSIYENIAYGKNEATSEEVQNAAKAAAIHEYIMSLPEGYDTLVGERGVKLSGGQKQRLSIARAILKDAPILLLDEATSSLDAESEYDVQQSVEMLLKNRTALVIAHRFSSIKLASKILVLNEGRIESSGTHEQLLQSSQIYRRLYLDQVSADFTREDCFVEKNNP